MRRIRAYVEGERDKLVVVRGPVRLRWVQARFLKGHMGKQVSADTDARLHLLKGDAGRVQLVLFMLDVGHP
eukprot:s2359_g9.t1